MDIAAERHALNAEALGSALLVFVLSSIKEVLSRPGHLSMGFLNPSTAWATVFTPFHA